jgi:syntaxin-binding protein 5
MVRTFEREDVNITSEEDLFAPDTQAEVEASAAGLGRPLREPIFRLAWSGFPQGSFLDRISAMASSQKVNDGDNGGETDGAGRDDKPAENGTTMLTILGGLLPEHPTGVHVIHLKKYTPTSVTAPSGHSALALPVREALRESTYPVGHSIYQTESPPEDFMLVPRSSPHYDMSYDPTAIIISISPPAALMALPVSRDLRAYSFPPRLDQEPVELQLPGTTVWSGRRTVTAIDLCTMSSKSLRRLAESTNSSHRIFSGGHASPRNGGDPAAARHAKHAPTRLFITAHMDFSIRIWDASDVLLSAPDSSAASRAPEPGVASVFAGRLKHEWPQLLREFDLSGCIRNPERERIDRVELATETLEFTCASSSGDVFVFRYGQL